jgi:3-dehydroquinate synthase
LEKEVMREVQVDLSERSYPIRIGKGILEKLGEWCQEVGLHGKCLLVSDENVAPLYAERVLKSLKVAGFTPTLKVVPAGEPTKCRDQLFGLYDALLENGMDRKSFIVALGGGVIGDLSGYAAASFLRGIEFVQVPTSLLAMVDSSVGGKTGINIPQGKNLIGAFHQPKLVCMDLDTLKTLAVREYRAGMAEIIKYGPIWDTDFFEQLEANAETLADPEAALDADWFGGIVARSCEIKAEVVHEDEREGGLRAILNFGHTVGHAIEKCAGYGEYVHGEAVAIGMVYAAYASVALTGLSEADAERIITLLKKIGLPVSANQFDWPTLRAPLAVDKKTVSGMPKFALVGPLGTAQIGCEIPEKMLADLWQKVTG